MVEPIMFMLMDAPTNPVFSPILPLIALAFADDAFANEGIRTPADLFKLRVEDPNNNYLEVPCILDTPIFRSVEPRKSYISKTMSLKYAHFYFHLKQLGTFAGFPDGVQRMQIMGHAREDVFKHYIHRTVQADAQAVFLGNPSRKGLIAGMSRMGASSQWAACWVGGACGPGGRARASLRGGGWPPSGWARSSGSWGGIWASSRLSAAAF